MKLFRWKRVIKLSIAVVLFGILFGFLGNGEEVSAAAKIAVTEIDYESNTITLKANSADKRIYFSDAKKAKWLLVPGEMAADKTLVFDIAWVTQSKDYIITFRGDDSIEEISVTIPKAVPKFKVTYDMTSSKVDFQNLPTGRTVEWRKSGFSQWNSVSSTTDMEKQIQAFYANGTTLYFRVAGIKGTSVDATGGRTSKEVSLRIAKRTAAPTIMLDGSGFQFLLKRGMAYKKPSEADWSTVATPEKQLLLKDILPEVLRADDGTGTPQDVELEFRNNASSSSQVSQSTIFKILAQREAPAASKARLEYTSKSGCSLFVADATVDKPYEYTIVKSGETLNLGTAVWSTVRSAAAVNFNHTAAPPDSSIYLREKSQGSTANGFVIASASKKIPIVASSFLGSDPTITETEIIMPFGSKDNLVFTVTSPVSTKIARVLIAGKEMVCSSTTGTTVIVTLPAADMWRSLEGYAGIGGDLSVKAVLENGEVLTTLVFKVLPASKIVAGTESSFQRIHGANTITASISLGFGAKVGSGYPTITKVECNGSTVPITATVYDAALGTVKVDLNLAGLTVDASTKYGITITLSSGEQLTDIANVTFHPIASLGIEETTLSFQQGSYGSDLNIEMLMNEAAAGTENITKLTWNGVELPINKISQVGKRVTVTVSQSAINNLTVSTTTVKPVIVTFDNGSKVLKGFNIRLIASAARSTGIIWSREKIDTVPLEAKNDEDQMITLASTGSARSGLVPSAAGDPNPGAVYVDSIDYEKAVIQINKNTGTKVFYSLDKKNWYLVEDPNAVASATTFDFDISWVSSTRATTIYFRGDSDLTELSVVLPVHNAKFNAKFDKVTGGVTFTSTEGAQDFQWRKVGSYTWQTAKMDETIQSYQDFLVELDRLRTKGGKVIIRTPSVAGATEADGTLSPGLRPSKEVTVSVTKRSTAPSVKLNVQKGTINSSTKMEYLDNLGWVNCTKNMRVDDFSAGSLSTSNIVHFRKKAYGKSAHSLETAVFIPEQEAAPALSAGSGSDVAYGYDEDGLWVTFQKASKATPYEYAVVLNGGAITAKTKWKSFTKSERKLRLNVKNAPNGAVVYVRTRGIKENRRKNIVAKLFSAEVSFVVTRP